MQLFVIIVIVHYCYCSSGLIHVLFSNINIVMNDSEIAFVFVDYLIYTHFKQIALDVQLLELLQQHDVIDSV